VLTHVLTPGYPRRCGWDRRRGQEQGLQAVQL